MRKRWQHLIVGFCLCVGAASVTWATSDYTETGGDPPIINNASVTAAHELLARAIADAGERLKHQGCSDFFGPAAVQTLTSAQYVLSKLGAPRFVGNRAFVTAARTVIEENIVLINLDGPFITPRLIVGGKRYRFNGILTGEATPIVVSDSQFRAVILLHELGHLLGTFAPDTNNLKQNQANNRAVLGHCFGYEV